MRLAVGLGIGTVIVLVLLLLVLVDQTRARRAHVALCSTAEAMCAVPIASMRNGAQIVFLRNEVSASDTPFVMLHAGQSHRLSAEEIRHLWKRGRLWWYGVNETPPLGMVYYLRYVDGYYDSKCSCQQPTDSQTMGIEGGHDTLASTGGGTPRGGPTEAS